MSQLAFPYRPELGRSARRDAAGHARDMLEALLFTSPGERVHRPEFGCGLNRLLFAGNTPELQGTLELTIRTAVQRWLGDILTIEALEVRVEESTLEVDLAYLLRETGQSEQASFSRGLS
jgi:phage baseplate assembly protein W